MSIVDCQNYPREYKPRICMNCRYYRKKQEVVVGRYRCAGYCTSEKVANTCRFGYRVDGAVYMPVMSNGSCMNYEEA